MSQTFEGLLAACRTLAVPSSDDERFVEWLGSCSQLGVSRQSDGGIEVFIRGGPLRTRSRLVQRHLRHDEWREQAGATFEANRVVLPSDDHFTAVAAFLAEELFRLGVEEDPRTAFESAEPLIEMALRGNALPEDVQIGLVGELLLLGDLLRSATSQVHTARCLDAWRGYEQSNRDFVFPERIEIEVKTTRGLDSRHPISRLSQIDPSRTPAGIPTEQLYLVSLGITPAQDADGVTIPDLVELILLQLGDPTTPANRNPMQELFLKFVARYGPEGRGYVHDKMKSWTSYADRWERRFVRVYDMNDPRLGILRKSDVESLDHVVPETVRLTVNLPIDPVSPRNPVKDVEDWIVRVGCGEG